MSNGKGRNGYIDVIKLFFALVILDFHIETGIFPGGRIVVEGFFMISGYLMMRTINSNRYPQDSLGVSTARFLYNKFKALFLYLFPAVIISFILVSVAMRREFSKSFSRIPLLIFDFFPLREAGFRGDYVIGISWYLSAMFLALAILYPLCKKYRTTMTMIVCPVTAVLLYGALSFHYGHMAIVTTFMDNSLISSGLLRGIAGCALGCTLYEICNYLSLKKVTMTGRVFFTSLEIIGFVFLISTMHNHPKSSYDFILIFVIFFLLLIGVGGISLSSLLFRGKIIKCFGTASTLIVLLHNGLDVLFKSFIKDGYHRTGWMNLYLICLAAMCVGVWFLGRLLQKLTGMLSRKMKASFWINE